MGPTGLGIFPFHQNAPAEVANPKRESIIFAAYIPNPLNYS